MRDTEQPGGEPEVIELANLEKEYYRLNFLVDSGNENLKREMEISIAAGDLVGVLYDALLKQYRDPTNMESLRSLNMLCVRIVFCLYCEDAGIFGKRTMFHDYMSQFDAKASRKALIELFQVLDQTEEERDPYLDDELKAFPYVNGGLFSDENIEIPNFTDEIRTIILSKASEDFDWSEISPTIFGAVFESTLNPETRRSGGMHYTSIENIHKVIDPLFLDELKEELEGIKAVGVERIRKQKLLAFQNKLASLKFLDPACGSGNFLTETYLSLRRLENEALLLITGGQITFGEAINPIKCSIQQFYGIEINDFAVTVAKTALWIAESQMMKETENIVHMNLDFLPLTTNATIKEGNALRLDWCYLHEEDKTPTIQAKKTNLISEYDLTPGMPIIVAEPGMVYGEVNLITEELHVGKAKSDQIENHYNYIMGNPPFVGFKFANATQKDDMKAVFMNAIKPALLDYVCCWYKKAAEYVKGTSCEVAFVSTNSVSQGQMAGDLWTHLLNEYKIHINFAWRSFVWQSESSEAAKVHVVIIGFSNADRKEKVLYTGSSSRKVTNISPYLIEGDNILITSRRDPLCDIPKMVMGNQAMDGGNLIIEEKDYEDFVTREPKALPYIKRYMMGYEFINNKKRYCLWLVNCPPEILRSMPLTMERVKAVREMRSSSNDAGARKKADTPMLFREQRNPKNFIAIPIVSSEKRRYIPIGYLDDSVIAGNKLFIVPDATLYHFGVLTSNVHMAWVRTVASRLKSDYTYSKDVVYNNFPWCNPTNDQRARIEETAQMILDARAKYPDSSLADLYDDLAMPPELRKAHQENDKAVMRAYGFSIKDTTESSCVATLMKLYQEKTAKE